MSARVILLEYVCPALGVITGNMMFAAPVRDCYQAVRAGKGLGPLNPTPWAFMLGNTIGWVAYGCLIQNLFVVMGNAPGLLMSVWLNLQAVKMQYETFRSHSMRTSLVRELEGSNNDSKSDTLKEEKEELIENGHSSRDDDNKNDVDASNAQEEPTTTAAAGSPNLVDLKESNFATVVWDLPIPELVPSFTHDGLVVANVALWLILLTLISFASSFSHATKELIVGLAVNGILVIFYGSPLSTIWTVLKSRNSSTIHIPTMLTNTFNGVFWGAYGIAVQNWFIILPNSLGAMLGGIQVILCVLMPRKNESTDVDEQTKENTDPSPPSGQP